VASLYTTNLISKNSTSRPHSVFILFTDLRTEIISLHSIILLNWLLLITEM